jgi:hypothetical protein
MLTIILVVMGAGRIAIGLAPFVAPRAAAVALGFPAGHDNPTARLMGRLFGARDAGLGVLTFYAIAHPALGPAIFLFNAATDLCDLATAAVPLIRRQGIDRGALATTAFAAPAAAAWIALWLFTR